MRAFQVSRMQKNIWRTQFQESFKDCNSKSVSLRALNLAGSCCNLSAHCKIIEQPWA